MQMFENEHAYRRAHILVKLFPHVLETIVKFAFHLDSKDTEAQTFLPRHLNLNWKSDNAYVTLVMQFFVSTDNNLLLVTYLLISVIFALIFFSINKNICKTNKNYENEKSFFDSLLLVSPNMYIIPSHI